jgi:N-acetyl-anhydromuramyl-L-alanine amidase AmpD
VFIGHHFEQVEEQDRKSLRKEYRNQLDRLFEQHFSYGYQKAQSELSDYSHRLDKKISKI